MDMRGCPLPKERVAVMWRDATVSSRDRWGAHSSSPHRECLIGRVCPVVHAESMVGVEEIPGRIHGSRFRRPVLMGHRSSKWSPGRRPCSPSSRLNSRTARVSSASGARDHRADGPHTQILTSTPLRRTSTVGPGGSASPGRHRRLSSTPWQEGMVTGVGGTESGHPRKTSPRAMRCPLALSQASMWPTCSERHAAT
jgi:hypothetical protein